MERFATNKQTALRKLDEALQQNLVDKAIIPLLNKLNASKNYYTTSSCAGRITIMKIPEIGNKKDAEWLFKTHDAAQASEVWRTLQQAAENHPETIRFKMDAPILHIGCRNLAAASALVRLAKALGFKRTGIFEIDRRIMVELMSTEFIDCPVAKDNKVIVSKEYAEVLTAEANKRLARSRSKMQRLLAELDDLTKTT